MLELQLFLLHTPAVPDVVVGDVVGVDSHHSPVVAGGQSSPWGPLSVVAGVAGADGCSPLAEKILLPPLALPPLVLCFVGEVGDVVPVLDVPGFPSPPFSSFLLLPPLSISCMRYIS